VVPQAEVDRLQAMGAWLKENGEAIYGTQPTLFGAEAGAFSPTEKDRDGRPKFIPAWNWRSTTRADKIYLEIFAWPTGAFHLENVPRKVTKAYLLTDPAHAPLKLTANGAALDIQLPAQAPDPIASVVVLETAK
jgi:alpha-L-fucosidase